MFRKIKKINIVILVASCLVVIFFRFYRLMDNPPSLFSDEVDAGYQAFTFNHCFSDYFGNKFPSHFHSFADWRTPLLIYSIALSQKIIGFNELAVRLPPAIFGLLACFVFLLIIQKSYHNVIISTVGFLLISFNPWFFHYSRAAWEVSGMIFVLLLGIFFWLRFLDSHKTLTLLLSTFFFCLTFYFYATAKLYIVFIFLSLFLVWYRQVTKLTRQQIFLSVISIVIFSIPLLIDIVKGTAGFRFSYINLFTDPELSPSVNYFRLEDNLVSYVDPYGKSPTIISKIFHNKATHLMTTFTKNYLSAFSTDYLFLHGDQQLRQGLFYRGNFFYFDLIFIIIGIASSKSLLSRFFLLLLIFSPIPFSLTRDSISPQSTRLIFMSPLLVYFTLQGILTLFSKLKTAPTKKIVGILILLGYLLCFLDFYHYYNFHYPNISAKDWHYGQKQAVIESYFNPKWTKIYYSHSYEPVIPFFFFYTNYLPRTQDCNSAGSLVNQSSPFFSGVQIQDKYFFGKIEWAGIFSQKADLSNTLFVLPQTDIDNAASELTKHNLSSPSKYRLQYIKDPLKKFTGQVPIYLIYFSKS